jgi:hypothetical protein
MVFATALEETFKVPELTVCYSGPVANICIVSLYLDRKHSEVSKTV